MIPGVMIRPDIALIAVAVIAALLVLWMAVRLKGLRADNARLKAASEQGREILAAAPDGLFLWDHAEVEERCSRRLAVLLDLSAGTGARFTDVLARFETPEAITLKNAVDDLHRNGTSFDIKLKLDKRTIGNRQSGFKP